MRKSRNMFYVVTLSTRPGEAQGWEGAQLLFKAKGGCSHVAARSFFCPDLPLLPDRRARGTSKHRWQALWQWGARCAQKAPCLHGARPPACQAGGHVLVQVYVQGTCCIPSPNPFFRALTMGGMAAARCFSCFRSSGFCGEEFSLASLAVLSRLGRGDSNLSTKQGLRRQCHARAPRLIAPPRPTPPCFVLLSWGDPRLLSTLCTCAPSSAIRCLVPELFRWLKTCHRLQGSP